MADQLEHVNPSGGFDVKGQKMGLIFLFFIFYTANRLKCFIIYMKHGRLVHLFGLECTQCIHKYTKMCIAEFICLTEFGHFETYLILLATYFGLWTSIIGKIQSFVFTIRCFDQINLWLPWMASSIRQIVQMTKRK